MKATRKKQEDLTRVTLLLEEVAAIIEKYDGDKEQREGSYMWPCYTTLGYVKAANANVRSTLKQILLDDYLGGMP